MSNRKLLDRQGGNTPGGAFFAVVEEVHGEKHLNPRLVLAASMLRARMQANHGTSAGLVGDLACKVDTTTRTPLYPLGGQANITDLDNVLKRLTPSNRELLRWMVTHREREQPRGVFSDWAAVRTSYKTSKTRRAAAVGRLIGLLENLAEAFEV